MADKNISTKRSIGEEEDSRDKKMKVDVFAEEETKEVNEQVFFMRSRHLRSYFQLLQL